MSEDDKPLYDIESYWEQTSGMVGVPVLFYEHSEYRDLKRIVDLRNQKVFFTDRKRVPTSNIIDINKAIPEIRKARIVTQAIRVLDAEKPISMPYVPEKIKVYVEDLGEYLGILYYMDTDDEKSLVPIKRFFRSESKTTFIEVPFDEYHKYKEEHENVDSDAGQTEHD